MHDENDLKYNIQLNGGATPHTFTTTHTWRRTLARETLMGATSWLKGCSCNNLARETLMGDIMAQRPSWSCAHTHDDTTTRHVMNC